SNQHDDLHIVCDIADDICRLKLLVFCKHSAISGQRSVVSGQRSALAQALTL
ncbi:MAG: hypothetical protein F6K56_40205, partial [Moorea sp. SIO3G5]|nr:hypothetical protein [Moorena sp. SIO3G5]